MADTEIRKAPLEEIDVAKLNSKQKGEIIQRLQREKVQEQQEVAKSLDQGKALIEGFLNKKGNIAQLRKAEDIPDSDLREECQIFITSLYQSASYIAQNMTGPTTINGEPWPPELSAVKDAIERNAVQMTSLHSQLEQKTTEFSGKLQELEKAQKDVVSWQQKYTKDRKAFEAELLKERTKTFDANKEKHDLEQKLKGEYTELEKAHVANIAKLQIAEKEYHKADDAYHTKLKETNALRAAMKEQSELAEKARTVLADSTKQFEEEMRLGRDRVAKTEQTLLQKTKEYEAAYTAVDNDLREALSRAHDAEQQVTEKIQLYNELEQKYKDLETQRQTLDDNLSESVRKIENLEKELNEAQTKALGETTRYNTTFISYNKEKKRSDDLEKKLKRRRTLSFILGSAAAGLIGLIAYENKPQTGEKTVEVPGPVRIVEKIEPNMVAWGLGFGYGKGVLVEESVQGKLYDKIFALQKEASRDYTEEDIRKIISFIDVNKPIGKIFKDEFDSAKFSEFNKRLGYKK